MHIYEINVWTTATAYKQYDFIKQGAFWYYATRNHTSTGTFASELASQKWNGVLTDGQDTKPFFFWLPSYNYDVPSTPKIKTIQFSDGYAQNLRDGINNLLLTFDLSFEERTLEEYTSIIHFFTERAGAESFLFIPPAPYSTMKRFLCKTWTPRQNFYNNYSIRAQFTESVT